MSLAVSLLPFHSLHPDILIGDSSAVEWEDVKLVLALKYAALLLHLVPFERLHGCLQESVARAVCCQRARVHTVQPAVAVACVLLR